jgi:hypothetical protein
MNNYIIISNFEEDENQKSFEKKIKDNYPRHLEEDHDDIRYLAFAARNQAGVEDKIKEILNEYGIGTQEYVALYYSRPDDADEIQRAMLLGHDSLIEADMEKTNPEDHVDTLSRLLNFDFVKEMQDK